MLTKFRPLIVFIGLILVAVAGSHLPDIKTKNNQRIFFERDDENLLTLERFEHTFGKVDNLIISLTGDSVFERDFLSSLKLLTDRAWMLPYASRSQSITNFQYSEGTNDGLIIRDLIPDPTKLNGRDLKELKDYALTEEYIKNILVGEDNRTAGILVTFQLPRIHDSKEIPAVMKALDSMLAEFRQEYPELSVRVSGTMATDYAFVQSSRKDLKTLIPISFLVMLLIIGLLAGGFRASFATCLCGLFSIIFTMGCAAYFDIALSSATSIAPIVILILTIAHSVHVIGKFINCRATGASNKMAAEETFRFNRYPILVATLTTIIGFLSFNFSNVPPFRDLGNLAAIGTGIAYFFTVLFLPVMLSYISLGIKQTPPLFIQQLSSLITVMSNRKILWAISLLVISSVLFYGTTRNQLNDVILHYFDDSIKYRQDTDFITSNLTGLYQIHYILDSGKSGGITEPEFLQDVENFVEWFRSHPKNISAASIGSTIKRLNMNLHGGDPNWYKLPNSNELSAQYLLLYEMSVPYGLDVNSEISIDKSMLRITVSFETLSSRELVRINEEAEAWARNNAKYIVSATGTGIALIFAKISATNMKSMIKGTTIALTCISFILIFALRSFGLGILSLIPNLVPLGIGFGIWGYVSGQVGLSLSVVSGMTLGIIVDDTVHFLMRYKDGMHSSLSSEESLLYTFAAVGEPIVITSISLVGGFLVLTLSPFYLNASLGLLTAIVIFAALLCDLVLLPALILLNDSIRSDSANVQ